MFTNFTMLLPLLRDMLAEDPTERPSAADALQHLRAIRREVPFIQRIWRPRKRIEPLIVTILCDLWSLVSGLFFFIDCLNPYAWLVYHCLLVHFLMICTFGTTGVLSSLLYVVCFTPVYHNCVSNLKVNPDSSPSTVSGTEPSSEMFLG